MNWIQRFLTAITGHKTDLDAHTRNMYSALRTGEYFGPQPHWGATTVKTLTASYLYAYAFPVPRDVTIDRLAVKVQTADPDKKVRIGIYNDGTNIYPGTLLLDAGEVDAGTVGVKVITIDQALAKGLYWLSSITDGTTTGLRPLYTLAVPLGLDPTDFGKLYYRWQKDQTYGALPDPFPAG